MTGNSSAQRASTAYSTTAKFLHWVLAALIIVQFVLAQLARQAAESDRTLERLGLLANHKSLGLTILALVVVRVAWRLHHSSPALPNHMNTLQRAASHISHATLYLLMLGLPLSGLVMSFTSVYGLSWFNLLEVPDLMAQNDELNAMSKDVHELLGYALLAIFIVHVAAALYHHFVIKDSVLRRMSSRVSIIVFTLLLAGLLFVLTPSSPKQVTDQIRSKESTTTIAGTEQTAPKHSTETRDLWDIDYEQSFIRFSAEQAGAKFHGVWQDWQAEISFSEQPLRVTIEVDINVAKPDTNDDERDATIIAADWFDAANYPAARFVLTDATITENGLYTGNARLTIKDLTSPVAFTFDIDSTGGARTLTGRTKLDRTALKVGTGEWADTSWVGQFVDVDVKVVTR